MPGHERSFWRRLEMLVMATACGTLLGTGLLAGAISLGNGDVAADAPGGFMTGALFHDDDREAYNILVIIDGMPVRMMVDTSAEHHRLSAKDAQRLFQPLPARVGSYKAEKVEIAGKTLHGETLDLSQTSATSVIGLNWPERLRSVTFDTGTQID